MSRVKIKKIKSQIMPAYIILVHSQTMPTYINLVSCQWLPPYATMPLAWHTPQHVVGSKQSCLRHQMFRKHIKKAMWFLPHMANSGFLNFRGFRTHHPQMIRNPRQFPNLQRLKLHHHPYNCLLNNQILNDYRNQLYH